MNEPIQIPEEEWLLIESWLLHGEGEEDVRQRSQSDPLWAQKLATVQETIIGVQESAMREKIKGFQQSLPATNSSTARVLRFRPWMAVAASLLLILGIGLWMYFQSDPYASLYADNYRPDPGLITAMGPAEDYAFQIGMVDYKNGDYEKAIDTWKQLLRQRPESDTLHYFLGAAYQADGKIAEAKSAYQQVLQHAGSNLKNEASWYLALIFLKEGEKEAAIEQLQQSNLPKASQLLKQLKS